MAQKSPAVKVCPQDPQIPILTAQVEALQQELNVLKTQINTPTSPSAEICCPGASPGSFIQGHAKLNQLQSYIETLLTEYSKLDQHFNKLHDFWQDLNSQVDNNDSLIVSHASKFDTHQRIISTTTNTPVEIKLSLSSVLTTGELTARDLTNVEASVRLLWNF